MKIRKYRVIGNSLVVLGVILLIIGLLMPYYRIPQRIGGTGPDVQFTPTQTYWMRTYIIPPIASGTPIDLSVMSDRPGATQVLLAPYDPQTQSLAGPPLVNTVFAKDQKGLVTFIITDKSSPYMLMITSYNSSYSFYLGSVWSPFYELRSSTTIGLAVLPIGIVTLYYDGIVERREKMFEAALTGIPKRTH